MNRTNSTMRQLCFIAMVALSFMSSSHAADPLNIKAKGEIFSLSRDSINVNDHFFSVIATVKVVIPGKQRAKLSDLNVGNFVSVELQKYNGRFFVDRIVLQPNLPSNE
ncbi:MAG: hypothetical protein ACI9KN_002345 [Gammaproteobacteria bacterium]|jgi:hypothetical protein